MNQWNSNSNVEKCNIVAMTIEVTDDVLKNEFNNL